MADRDQYRGYGSPSGRYYENREYDTRAGDRDRGRDGWRGSGRDDNRGFFERAGDEIRSWFGEDDYRREEDRYRFGSGQYDGRDRGYSSRGLRDRDFSGDAREPWGGGDYASYARRGRFDHAYPHDENYSAWRQNQIDALDRDYDEYRRENRDRFDNEFSNWRTQRQKQRTSLRDVREHMDVVGSDGEHVGTVDCVRGDRVVLTKSDAAAGGHHHSIPCGWIQNVDDKVTINKTAEQARNQWKDEENRRALFESEDQRRDDGPHILERSFSGTYNYR
ncbi:MAG: DUF2171 domain-containing protein [Proteobacteria bacterium]|nr:DUF2171 domain-containing protein [Pseudomonadota bacterium]